MRHGLDAPALTAPTDVLRCPHCHRALARAGRQWRCDVGHVFDVARQGYVNLVRGRSRHSGDNAEMLEARAAVLHAGHLDAVTDAVVAACRPPLPAGAVVEIGAGTAHHLAAVRRALGPRYAVALDVSVAAAKRAARADPEWTTAVVADAWQPWPLLDASSAAVITIFAPRNVAETARVLAPGGRFVAVVPHPAHLRELAAPLGLLDVDDAKRDRLREQTEPFLELAEVQEVRTARLVERDAAVAMALMGPGYHHRSRAEVVGRAGALPQRLHVTVAVDVLSFTLRTAPRSTTEQERRWSTSSSSTMRRD